MKRIVFVIAFLLSGFAQAQSLNEVDVYLNAVNQLPAEIVNLLVRYEKETNNYAKGQLNTKICLKTQTLAIIGETFSEDSAFSRAAASKDPWTFRNGRQMQDEAQELFNKWCVPGNVPGVVRISVKEAQKRARALQMIGAQESVGGGSAR